MREASANSREKISLSDYLSEHVKIPYRSLSEIFKRQKGISIEKYFILQKIEKAKDLVEKAPQMVKKGVDKKTADEMKKKIEAAGGKVTLK